MRLKQIKSHKRDPLCAEISRKNVAMKCALHNNGRKIALILLARKRRRHGVYPSYTGEETLGAGSPGHHWDQVDPTDNMSFDLGVILKDQRKAPTMQVAFGGLE